MKSILVFATIFLAACASTPPAPNAQVIEPAPQAPTEDEQSAADKRFAEEARTYKLVVRDGKQYYCRAERASGSNLKTTKCITESELRARVESAEVYRKRSRESVCAVNESRCGGA